MSILPIPATVPWRIVLTFVIQFARSSAATAAAPAPALARAPAPVPWFRVGFSQRNYSCSSLRGLVIILHVRSFVGSL